MTDNEIIKALECCLKGCNAEGCEDCPLYEKVEDCEIEIPIIALDLINRQKAEIENLREENEIYRRANFLIAGQRDERDKEIVCLEAELESVKSGADLLEAEVKRLEKRPKTAKSEAIREFASKLTSRMHKLDNYECDIGYGRQEQGYLVDDVLATIDNLVREMTEERK